MAVYVDNAANQLGRMVMCHMFADTAAELHRMAEAIGMRRAWYQSPDKASFPHYDVCLTRRKRAVMLGAVQVDRRGGYLIRQRIRDRFPMRGWGEWA